MIRYKLTNSDRRTHGGFHYAPGEWARATGDSNTPCSNGVLHYYDSPLVAMLMNPAHGDIREPLLWEFETADEIGHDGLKGWCKAGRIVRRVVPPEITTEQRTAFALRVVAEFTDPPAQWSSWARAWLSREDRSREVYAADAATDAATNAANAAAANAALAAANVARSAAYANANAATNAANAAAANAAHAALAAANVARSAAYANANANANAAYAAAAAAHAALAAADVARAVAATDTIRKWIREYAI